MAILWCAPIGLAPLPPDLPVWSITMTPVRPERVSDLSQFVMMSVLIASFVSSPCKP